MAEEEPVKQPSSDNLNLSKVDEALIRTNPKFQKIPKEQREEMVRAVVSITKIHNGPLPPVELIQGYEDIYPGSAKLIFDVFERQSNHRIKMEDTVITSQQRQSGRGQHYALIIAILFLAVAAVCILKGHDIAGGALGSIDVLGMVAIFITGKSRQATNLRQKEIAPTQKVVPVKKKR